MGAIFLLIAIPLLMAYLWMVSKTTRWMRNQYPQTKWPARLMLIFWILLPTWDSILALGYHRYVCATDSEVGVHIYQTVKLDPRLFDPNTGEPMIYDKYHDLDRQIVGENIAIEILQHKEIGVWPLKVISFGVRVVNKKNNTVLTEYKDYYASGGAWWTSIFGALEGLPKASRCLTEKYGHSLPTMTVQSAFSK
jgi:hypothetical protein